jgi:cellobiose phosphorylase
MTLSTQISAHAVVEPYGYFDDPARTFVITDPVTPRPWINYLSNRRLSAFISQNAGGLLWHWEPLTRRITRYHYIPAPADRPGFYLYVRDARTGTVWNPHFAPTCIPLDDYTCRHEPGITSFAGEKDGVRVEVAYTIPPDDDVMLWQVRVTNTGTDDASLLLASYLEFGLLEHLREILAWCYLKSHIAFSYDPALRAIRYDYHAFEAPFTPRMLFGCTAPVAGFECARDAFVGRVGSLERPQALVAGHFSNSELPLGGHGCGVLGVDVALAPGESTTFAYRFAIGESWEESEALLARYADDAAVEAGFAAVRAFWSERLGTLQVTSDDPTVDRFINTWIPYNNLTTLAQARIISTDQMGLDGLKYRDTTQDALGVANLDPAFSAERLRLVYAQQTQDGGGCYGFYPYTPKPVAEEPHRSDNTVWQIYTLNNLLAETGEWGLVDEVIPFRDGGEASIYEHTLRGLRHIDDRRGPHGLPMMFHADWNDGLALFGDERAESVMLGMQLVYSCREFAALATRMGRPEDAAWCRGLADELTAHCNAPEVWDGGWYRRLLLSNGTCLGSAANRQGSIFLNPQSWAVLSGVGEHGARGRQAMDAVAARLDSAYGLVLLAPPYFGIPEPEDPPLGSSAGTNENGSIFSHANTWAIIAECLLGRPERAYAYFRQVLPQVVASGAGSDHYGREPYVYVSSIVGPVNARFGEGGISWLTGTASWMQVAATHYLLGLRPTYDGLELHPCLPASVPEVHIRRAYRGCTYDIHAEYTGEAFVEVEGARLHDALLPVAPGETLRVRCGY